MTVSELFSPLFAATIIISHHQRIDLVLPYYIISPLGKGYTAYIREGNETLPYLDMLVADIPQPKLIRPV